MKDAKVVPSRKRVSKSNALNNMTSPSAIASPQNSHRVPEWVFVALVLLVIGTWSAWDAYIDFRQVMEQEYRLLEVRASQHEARISGALRSVGLMLGSIIDDLSDHPDWSSADRNRRLKVYMRQLPELRNLAIVDARGLIQADAREESVGKDASGREYFKYHRGAPERDAFKIVRPFKAFDGVTVTSLSRVVRDKNGRFSGVVVASLDSKYFNEALTLAPNESGVQAVLINLDGDILNMVPDVGNIGKSLQGGIAYTGHISSGLPMTRHLNINKFTPVKKLSVFRNLPDAPLAVIASREYDAVFAGWRVSLYWHIGGFLLVIATTLFFFQLAARRRALLVRAQSELSTIIETEPECVMQMAADGTLSAINRAGLDMIEADTLKQALGGKVQQLVKPEHRDRFMALTQRVFAGESGDLAFEIEGLKGGARWLKTHAVPLRDPQGKISALLGLTRDITERKQMVEALEESEARFRRMFEQNDSVMLLIEPESGSIVDANAAAARFYGYPVASLKTMRIDQINTLSPAEIAHRRAQVSHHERNVFIFPHRIASGEVRSVEVRSSPIEVGGRGLLFSIIHDVTEQKRAESALQDSEARLSAIFKASPIGIVVSRLADGKILDANDAALRLYGYTRVEAIGRTVAELGTYVNLAQREKLVQRISEQGSVDGFPVDFRNRSGQIGILEVSGRIIDLQGEPCLLSMSVEVTERKRLEEEIHDLAFNDALTHLPNRRLLQDRLGQAMAAAKRNGHYGALMFIDLDNFKPLNDAQGHEVGDLLLIDAAARLNACVRKVDTAARFGGDEFVVMLGELKRDEAESVAQARAVAEKIRAALSRPYVLTIRREGSADTTVEHRCTASIGVALFGATEAGQDDILRWADVAMYQAKDAGRNSVRFFDSHTAATAL